MNFETWNRTYFTGLCKSQWSNSKSWMEIYCTLYASPALPWLNWLWNPPLLSLSHWSGTVVAWLSDSFPSHVYSLRQWDPFSSLCVCTCMCVVYGHIHMWGCIYVYVFVHACTPNIDIRYFSWSFFTLFFLDWVSHWIWSLLTGLAGSQEAPGISLSLLR